MSLSNFLSHRLQNLKPSPTLEIAAKAASLQAQGIPIVSLSAGEPDFDTPDFIKQAARVALEAGYTKYTPVEGILPLRKAIACKALADTGVFYDTNQIVVGCGAKQILFNTFLATINPQDEVIIPAPYWVSYPDMVDLAGGKPVIIPCDAHDNFKISPEALASAIMPSTKWLVLNSPSNPTGAIYTKEELVALAEVLYQCPHVGILCDDIYESLVYNGSAAPHILEIAPYLSPRTLVVNGVSKSHAMTGWRIGWACGPAELIKAMKNIQSQSTSNPASISQYAALAALEDEASFRETHLKAWLRAYDERRRYVVEALNQCPGLSCTLPDGAFYVYVNCEGLLQKATTGGKILTTDTDVCTYLLEEAQVAVVPGQAFGLSPYFRVSYATSLENLTLACAQIFKACARLVNVSN